ncbi:MAG: nucleotidyl transferase AbiEii/AbiGii toxin family protein [Acidobacteria bacterium]|nr:nucleotidyl transferase AbiEii/AbiGii toxin family protein [Acidobacteriota bacterium]
MIKVTEQNDVLGDFTNRLDKLEIEYMLVGSMALVHYANPRATVDIDIVINILPGDIDRFFAEFEQDYYIPNGAAIEAIHNKAMFNLLNNQTILKIDCIVLRESEYDLNAFSRRRKVNYAGDFDVWIVSKEDLILSKLRWAKKSGSERQLLDVASIVRNGFDNVYVDAWAKKLDLTDLLAESFDLLERNHVDGHDS